MGVALIRATLALDVDIDGLLFKVHLGGTLFQRISSLFGIQEGKIKSAAYLRRGLEGTLYYGPCGHRTMWIWNGRLVEADELLGMLHCERKELFLGILQGVYVKPELKKPVLRSKTLAPNISGIVAPRAYSVWRNVVFKSGDCPVRRLFQMLEPISAEEIRGATFVGQFCNEVLVLKGATETDLLLVDQHAAHERVRLEHLIRNFKPGCETIPHAYDGLVMRIEKLHALGFQFDSMCHICAIPRVLEGIEEKVPEIVLEYNDPLMTLPFGHKLMDVLKMKACRGAVKFGDALGEDVAKEIIADLARCDFPLICAHGRPTVKKIKISELF